MAPRQLGTEESIQLDAHQVTSLFRAFKVEGAQVGHIDGKIYWYFPAGLVLRFGAEDSGLFHLLVPRRRGSQEADE